MAKKSKNDRLAVDAYLATLPRAERESLEALRTLIKHALPHAEERVSYRTTVMFSLGRHNPFLTPAPASDGTCEEDFFDTGPEGGRNPETAAERS